MAIKKLQNNFTTPEQSERLLELGVPVDSADCYLLRTRTKGDTFIVEVLHDKLYSNKYKFEDILEYLPCWSVGRLMDIIRICNLTAEKPWVYIEQDNIHAMITAITDGVNNNMLDFSKLEE